MKRKDKSLHIENPPNLYLVGFMGTGKTVLGKRLSQRLAMKFIDSDDEIEKKCGMKIKEIFEKKGEDFFRNEEREFIEHGHPSSGCIVACGGGLVCRGDMPEIVRKKGVSIVLFCDADTILNRVSRTNKRPLLQVENPLEKIKILLNERDSFYKRSGACVSSKGNFEAIEDRIINIYNLAIKKRHISR